MNEEPEQPETDTLPDLDDSFPYGGGGEDWPY